MDAIVKVCPKCDIAHCQCMKVDYLENCVGEVYEPKLQAQREYIERLEVALKQADEKLSIFRKHSNGEYQGGMEYTALKKLIEQALASKPKDIV